MNETYIAENFPKDKALEEMGVTVVSINSIEVTPESFIVDVFSSGGEDGIVVAFISDEVYFAAFRVDQENGVIRRVKDYSSRNVVIRYNNSDYEVGSDFL